MKVLVATRMTQGRRKSDFYHAQEGELVTYGWLECSNESVDGKCGCKRSLCGFDSGKATTTFRVVTSDVSKGSLRELLRAKLTKGGWISEVFTAKQNDEMLEGLLQDTLRLWGYFAQWPEGTIVERRGLKYNQRLTVV